MSLPFFPFTRPGAVATRSDTVLVTSEGYAADDVQNVAISGSPTGGSFNLSFGGSTTTTIAFNAAVSTVQTDLAALTSIGSGNIAVSGAAGGPYTVRFIGTLAGKSEAVITGASSFTGGSSPALSIAVTSLGGDAGLQQSVTDPRGIVSKTDYDLLGRTVRTISGFVNGVPSNADDQTTVNTYDGDNNMLTETAVMPAGTNSQTTAYVYGIGSTIGTDLFSNDIMAKLEFPDKTTGLASTSASNDEVDTYNLQGDQTSLTDQDGDVHAYSYDTLDRLTLDAVTTLGSGVNGTVRALGYSFDTGGRPYQDTSYSSATSFTSGTTVNQVQYAYDGWGQEVIEYQEDAGAVNTSTSAKVRYNYTENIEGQNNDRLMGIIYPNGSAMDYTYSNPEFPLTGITHSGTTATATMLTNAYSVGNSVTISGASIAAYDGTFTVTAVNNTTHTFSYVMGSTPTANATDADLTVITPGNFLSGSISRITGIIDHAGTSAGTYLEAYSYLGLSTVVTDQRTEANEYLTYLQVSGDTHYNSDGGDQYTGLDRFGRVIDQYWVNSSSPPNAIDRFQYGYDRDGNVLYEKNLVNGAFSELFHANSSSSGDNNSAYDTLDRLTSFLRGTLSSSGNNGSSLDTITNANVNSTFSDSAATWTLDAVGNWTSSATGKGSGGSGAPSLTSTSRTENAQNEIGTVGAGSLTYDNNGNVTKNSAGYTLAYDAWNRLITSTDLSMVLTYDAMGRPTHFVTSSGNNNYVYHDMAGRWIQDSNGGIYEQLLYGVMYQNEIILRDRHNGTGGNYGISGSALSERIYAQFDANYDVTSLYQTSGTAAVAERIIYDPYGNPQLLTSAWANFSSSTLYFRVLYQGEYWLGESNTYIMGARMYDYSLGTWDQKDLIGYPNGMDTYMFVGGSPASSVDPSGMQTAATGPTSRPTTSIDLPGGGSPSTQDQTINLPAFGILDIYVRNDTLWHSGGDAVLEAKFRKFLPCPCKKVNFSQQIKITINNKIDPDALAGIEQHEISEHGGNNPLAGYVPDNGYRSVPYVPAFDASPNLQIPNDFAPPLSPERWSGVSPFKAGDVVFGDGPWLPSSGPSPTARYPYPRGADVTKDFILQLSCGRSPIPFAEVIWSVRGVAGSGLPSTVHVELRLR